MSDKKKLQLYYFQTRNNRNMIMNSDDMTELYRLQMPTKRRFLEQVRFLYSFDSLKMRQEKWKQ